MRGVSIAKESSASASVQIGQELLLDCDFSFDKEEVGKYLIIKKGLAREVILLKSSNQGLRLKIGKQRKL